MSDNGIRRFSETGEVIDAPVPVETSKPAKEIEPLAPETAEQKPARTSRGSK